MPTLLTSLLLSAPLASAQDAPEEISVDGDFDCDGAPDLATAPAELDDEGRAVVRIRYGAGGKDGRAVAGEKGVALSVVDEDGDGCDDLGVGAPAEGLSPEESFDVADGAWLLRPEYADAGQALDTELVIATEPETFTIERTGCWLPPIGVDEVYSAGCTTTCYTILGSRFCMTCCYERYPGTGGMSWESCKAI